MHKELNWWSDFRYHANNIPLESPIPFQDYIEMVSYYMEDEGNGKSLILEGSIQYLFNHYSQLMWGDNRQDTDMTDIQNIVAQDLKKISGDIKIIFIVRDPTDAVYSAFRYFCDHRELMGQINPHTFHTAVSHQIEVMRRCEARSNRHRCSVEEEVTIGSVYNCMYMAFYHYSIWLREWLRVFPMKQIKIVRLEDMSEHTKREQVMRELFTFLEIEQPDRAVMDEMVNLGKHNQGDERLAEKMMGATREMLKTYYEWHVRDLVQVTGDDRFYDYLK